MSTGDCFEVAAKLALGERLTLVHGLPVGRSGPPRGKRYWHAWVECTETLRLLDGRLTVELAWVFDRSNGKNVALPQAVYYKLGQLDGDPERWTWHYTPEQAAEHMWTFETYGPWVEGWQTMTDER